MQDCSSTLDSRALASCPAKGGHDTLSADVLRVLEACLLDKEVAANLADSAVPLLARFAAVACRALCIVHLRQL